MYPEVELTADKSKVKINQNTSGNNYVVYMIFRTNYPAGVPELVSGIETFNIEYINPCSLDDIYSTQAGITPNSNVINID